ncbi:MAG: hypothetical protein U9Q20_04370 [Campylobacterota bacterium]|nr:hypothetical protein [Campylobacterota bacterium]
MERRNWSLKSLHRLSSIDLIENESNKAALLSNWVEENLITNKIENFDLNSNDMIQLSELLYKNIHFFKTHRDDIKEQLDSHYKIKQFLS